jgi:hypothetical protein
LDPMQHHNCGVAHMSVLFLQGVRRVVGVTGAEAVAAIAEADKLLAQVRGIAALPASEMAAAVTAAKTASDAAEIPATAKALIRDQLTALGKVGGAGGHAAGWKLTEHWQPVVAATHARVTCLYGPITTAWN